MATESENRGQGSVSLRDLFEPGHQREGANMLARALRLGYVDIFGIDYAYAKKKAMEMTKSDDRRIQAAGTKLLVAMAAHDLKLMELASGETREATVHEHRHFVVPPPRLIGES